MNTPADFSTAKLLKEKGFDKVTDKSYRISINPERPLPTEPITDENTYFPNVKESYSAPTIADVIMWLYEKHGIWICVATIPFEKHFMFEYSIHNRSECLTQDGVFNSPTEAYEAAIEYTLKNLLP